MTDFSTQGPDPALQHKSQQSVHRSFVFSNGSFLLLKIWILLSGFLFYKLHFHKWLYFPCIKEVGGWEVGGHYCYYLSGPLGNAPLVSVVARDLLPEKGQSWYPLPSTVTGLGLEPDPREYFLRSICTSTTNNGEKGVNTWPWDLAMGKVTPAPVSFIS